MEFNPNNNKTEEVGGRVKETLQEKNLSLIERNMRQGEMIFLVKFILTRSLI